MRSSGGRPTRRALVHSLDELLPRGPRCVVIAAPTALHARPGLARRPPAWTSSARSRLGFAVEDVRGGRRGRPRGAGTFGGGLPAPFDPDWLALAGSRYGVARRPDDLFRCSHRNPAEPDGSLGDLFVDIAVHDLDRGPWLAGEPSEVMRAPRRGVHLASLRERSPRPDRREPPRGLRLRVLGRAGQDAGDDGVGRRGGDRAVAGRARAVAAPGGLRELHEAAYVAELDHFFKAVASADSRGADGEDAVAALRLALLAQVAAASAPASSPGR